MVDWIDIAANVLLFALVFGMSATVDIKCLNEQIHNRKAILMGIFLSFVVLPFIGFLVVSILDMDHTTGVMLLVVTSSPGGSYSNWWCSMFNADLALSVTMTAISTVLSTVFLPLNLLIYARYSYDEDIVSTLNWTSLFTALAIVIGAIALGILCSAKEHSHKFNMMANRLGNVAGIALVIVSATMTNTGGEDTKIWERDWKFYVGTMLPCLLGLLVANILTSIIRLKKPERVTASIECCYQNVGIATSVALTMFEGDELAEAIGVPFFYGVVTAVILSFYCIGAWKVGWTKAPRDAPFWKVIATSYEVLQAEQRELDEVEVKVSDSDETKEEINESGNALTTYFYMASEDKPKEPSGLDPTDHSPAIA